MTNLYHKYGIFRRRELFYQDKILQFQRGFSIFVDKQGIKI